MKKIIHMHGNIGNNGTTLIVKGKTSCCWWWLLGLGNGYEKFFFS